MRWRIGRLMAALALAALSCSCAPRIRELPLAKPNPTEAVVALSFQRAHDEALALLSLDSQTDAPIFGPMPTTIPEEGEIVLSPSLTVETSHDVALGGKVFADPANVHDFYIHNFHRPLWRSPVYRGEEGGLPFMAGFHVHFKEEGPSSTRISVTAIDPSVINGRRMGFGHGGVGREWRVVPVKATTIEEAMILRHIVHGLGQPELPPLSLPAAEPEAKPATESK